MSNEIHFYTHPYTRGSTVNWMLEEIGEPFDVTLLDFKKGDNKKPEYLKINPMGKIPALVHKGVVVTETAAICAYLADAFPQKKLAPALDNPQRGTYLRWLFFAAGAAEYAMVDKMMNRPTVDAGRIGYGSFDAAFSALEKAIEKGPYILGDQFSAADVFISSMLNWGSMMKAVPETPAFQAYMARCKDRPAFQRATLRGQDWLKQLEK